LPGTEVSFVRSLGLFDATMIGIGAMIGAGIIVLTGIAAGEAGPAALLAFALNGLVTLLTALAYAELASAYPKSGGGYAFIAKAFPGPAGFVGLFIYAALIAYLLLCLFKWLSKISASLQNVSRILQINLFPKMFIGRTL
jgi:amino acid transporter